MSAGVRRANGLILDAWSNPIADTVKCVHCGGHWVHQPGSGIERGYCMRCAGPYCGAQCQACIPEEEFLRRLERAARR